MNLHEIMLAKQLAGENGGGNVDLSNYYTKSQTDGLISAKVDKADSMGLSENNFTDAEKSKLSGLENYDDTEIKSDLSKVSSALNNKVDKVSGKGLSTNDFTNADKSKLDGLENYDDTNVKADIANTAEQTAINKSTLGYQVKNLLKNTAKTTTTGGVTFTVSEDKSVKITGTANSTNYINLVVFSGILPNRKMIISGCPNGGGVDNYRIRVGKVTSSDTNGEYLGVDYGDGLELIPDGISKYTVMLQVGKTFATSGQVFYPMIRYAEITDDTYEPYRPSVAEYIANLEERISALESVNLTANSINSSLNTTEINTTEEEIL